MSHPTGPRPPRPHSDESASYPLADAPHVIPVVGKPEPYPLGDPPLGPGRAHERPLHRRYLATLLIGTTVALGLGHVLRQPSQFEANDVSRWCTVWSLLERGSYVIDDCPWQAKTQDKVKKSDKLAAPGPDADPLKQLEYQIAPESWKSGEPTEHFYSSKPPLLPTIIAGILYPARRYTGIPIDHVVEQKRLERNVQKQVPGEPGEPPRTEFVKEIPAPAPWPAYVLYFKPVVVLLNIVPWLVVLILYARLLDRVASDDWCWAFCLFAAALGTYLFSFNQTLNNHTIAAASAFLSIFALQRIWSGDSRSGWTFAAAGFWGAFTACNEIPAALLGVLLFLILFARFPGKTLATFLPAALVPLVAFLATQYLAFGQFRPVYEEFGTKSYTYEGSYWNTPLELDWFNLPQNQEPWETYLFHMTLGHHGVFSLSPIFLLALWGALREMFRRSRLTPLAWLTMVLTIAMLAFYTWNPKARNYGGSTQGLRWLFWLIPFWLTLLPAGVRGGDRSRWVRAFSLGTLLVSALSVGYAMRNPWSHPWILDMLEHLDIYTLVR